MRGSMGRKGNPYGNAYAESFFKTLKNEEVYTYDYDLMGFTPHTTPFFYILIIP